MDSSQKPSHRLIRAQRLMIASIILSLIILATDALLTFTGSRFSSLPAGLLTIAHSAVAITVTRSEATGGQERALPHAYARTLAKAVTVYTNWLIFSLWPVVFGLLTSTLVTSHRRDIGTRLVDGTPKSPLSEFIVLFSSTVIEMGTTFCIALLCIMERRALMKLASPSFPLPQDSSSTRTNGACIWHE